LEKEIEKIILIILSLFSISVFLGLLLSVLRGFVDGYFDGQRDKLKNNWKDEDFNI
jgi:hypothetical protein